MPISSKRSGALLIGKMPFSLVSTSQSMGPKLIVPGRDVGLAFGGGGGGIGRSSKSTSAAEALAP